MIIPNKAATSLQTTDIPSKSHVCWSRPDLSWPCLPIGNWWNIILLPVLLILLQELVIKREEQYLALRFGEAFNNTDNKYAGGYEVMTVALRKISCLLFYIMNRENGKPKVPGDKG